MYTLPDLGYNYDALGDYISKDIMELHHSKHHQTYVDKLNGALDQEPSLKEKSLEELLKNLESLPESVRIAIRNNGGGHLNHSLFWQWMSPDGGGQPGGELASALNAKYGDFQGFIDEFTKQSLGVFGSGWAWLMPDLTITTTANQDNPIMQDRQSPILGLDVWEHAYYLDYKNVRADYVKAWWEVVNWSTVEDKYGSLKG